MSNFEKIKRIKLIIEETQNGKAPSKEQLINKLQEYQDINISGRTLERILKTIREEFFIEIKYSSQAGGYIINSDDSETKENIKDFLNFVDLFSIHDIYLEGVKDYRNFHNYILLEDRDNYLGTYNLITVLKAIKNQKKISFIKENYTEHTTKPYVVSPLKIKQYARRWYLIAVPDDINEIRNFGMERISEIKILKERSINTKAFESELKNYDDIVGINYNSSSSIVEIKLSAYNDQIKYLKSLKLHHSQKCVEGIDSDWGTVTYKLKPNFEFECELLKLGDSIKVESPEWFKNRLIERIESMRKLYSK